MEVGDEAVDGAEAVAGGDEDRGVALERPDPPGLVGGAFQQAQRGRADRDDPAARGPRRVEPGGRRGRDPAPFGVHDMVVGVVGLDRQEGAGADMEGQRLVADPGLGERRHQRRA